MVLGLVLIQYGQVRMCECDRQRIRGDLAESKSTLASSSSQGKHSDHFNLFHAAVEFPHHLAALCDI
jgi:hypothetical protein